MSPTTPTGASEDAPTPLTIAVDPKAKTEQPTASSNSTAGPASNHSRPGQPNNSPDHNAAASPVNNKPRAQETTQVQETSQAQEKPKDKEPSPGASKLQAPPNVRIIPEARKCNFEQFVNRFSVEEAGYAVEYIESGVELGKEMAQEVERRHRGKVEGYEDRKTENYKSRRFDGGLSQDTWIQAIRIQSRTVLRILGEVSGYNWDSEPHTFMRPFGHLVHFHPKMRGRLGSMKVSVPESENADIRDQMAVDELQCYVSFIEDRILPLVDQFQDNNFSKPGKIRFHDLWYLFKPGELVYIPITSLRKTVLSRNIGEPTRNPIYQAVWRLAVFQPGDDGLEHFMHGSSDDIWAYVYFIDYDGTAYKTVRHVIKIPYFDGEKDIRKLELFPIRFARDSEAMLDENRAWGRKFTECIEQRHVSYKAWTLLTEPMGSYYNDSKGKVVTSPEHIDGDIVVDFQEAFNAYPPWKYSYGLHFSQSWESSIEAGNSFPILLWSDTSRSQLLFRWPNVVVSDDDIGFVEAAAFDKNHQYGETGLEKPLEEDLVILPRRLFGYALRERKFVFLDVKDVSVARKPVDAFRFLQIDDNNLRTIKYLVRDHFATKKARQVGEISSQDPIPGKGYNLVFLLHGPPGVGKTATVEAVAQVFQKPLFSITSGDLGSTPDAVESSLTEIFHLANVWDCILLLDEADVFLEEREKRDLARNAVVSVFLRVMEYYNGILFLTTNRPGQLDEAIKSRVHCTLLYQNLSLHQTREIFRRNIERLELIERQRQEVSDPPGRRLNADRAGILAFAESHWATHEKNELGRWNGRQIRNAFVSAAALARCEMDEEDGDAEEGAPATLTERHFEFVAQTITSFDTYMARARGGLDSERARIRSDRPENFVPGEEPGTGRERRKARAPLKGFSSLGQPSTPTPTSSYFMVSQDAVPVPMQVQVSQPQPQQFVGGYAYPQQGYGSAPAAPPWQTMQGQPIQGQPIQAGQGGFQTPLYSSPPQGQQFHPAARQGGPDAGMGMSPGMNPGMPPQHVSPGSHQPHQVPDGAGGQ